MFKKILKVFAAAIVLLIVAGISATIWFVIYSPGDKIRQEAIEKILAMESPVFYNDGISKIGVFFKEAHRQYIYYRDIPTEFSNALVAAEDNSFFSHHGVDFTGILRALQANIRAGKIVQGGSTITQQTAKNLFKRKDRSYISKLKELLFAFQLEFHYSKEKILEFYANQFYVSGNGHGLGVAARYYFDKPASELDLLECAFIAGSVKRPNYYNPFTKDSEEEVQLAKARAKQRTAYVLKQMYKLGMISMERYETELGRDIDFKKGKMKYPLNSVMDTVKAALNTPAIEEALAQHGIDNVATSGIRIFTTIDRGLQERALAAVRKELSRLDVRLRGYDGKELQNRYHDLADTESRSLSKGSFLFGRIADIDAADPTIRVTFGEQSATGRIDKVGLMPLLDALMKWQNQRWTEADDSDLPLLLKQLHVQDLVYVSIRGSDEKTGEYLLDLEKYPELQGALLARQNGVIRAMVGGMENHFFNRAIAAKRPMGSIMKPLVFAAALQLGWNSVDPLNNQRDIFIFHDQPYFPRPDHFSPYDHVSISWAGVHSENVATVWLLYHLCDHLTPGQFKDLVANVDLARRQDESYQQYSRRIRDEHGIIVDQESLYRSAFRTAVKEIEADLIFAGRLKEYEFLKTLHYGTGFEDFAEEVDLLNGPEYESEARQKELVTTEIEVRKSILARSFLNFIRLREELRSLRNHPQLYDSEEMTGRLYYNRLTAAYIYSAKEMTDADEWQPLTATDLSMVAGQFPASAASEQASTFFNSVLIEGMLSSETLDLLKAAVEKKYKYLAGLPPYSPQVLHDLQDFRVTAGLYYLTDLGHALGITSQLDPVLSFPLGSNVISPLETARLYETLVTGKKISYGPDGDDQPAIIDRIENSDGEAVYQTTAEARRLFSPKTTVAVSDILQNVIRFGTGRQARDNVRLQSANPATRRQLNQLNLHVPLLGKTGTANRFTNSAFAGYIPEVAAAGNHLILDNGYTVAVYVGFDDNAPMVRTSTHITGSSGALPLWIRFVNSLLYEKEYDSRLDLVDITFNATLVSDNPTIPLTFPPLGQVEMEVSRGSGLLLQPSNDSGQSDYSASHPTVITFGSTSEDGGFEPSRFFAPYWQKISDDF
jgi:penicillin-binding protein 1A